MSIFSAIKDAIFGAPAHAETIKPTPTTPGAASSATAAQASATAAGTAVPPKVVMSNVDVAAVLDKRDEDSDEDLDWRVSIVDLMKLLKIDSSLKARKQLAQELKFDGDMNDSAKMNVWLHKQVMQKLAENGGIVPADLSKK